MPSLSAGPLGEGTSAGGAAAGGDLGVSAGGAAAVLPGKLEHVDGGLENHVSKMDGAGGTGGVRAAVDCTAGATTEVRVGAINGAYTQDMLVNAVDYARAGACASGGDIEDGIDVRFAPLCCIRCDEYCHTLWTACVGSCCRHNFSGDRRECSLAFTLTNVIPLHMVAFFR